MAVKNQYLLQTKSIVNVRNSLTIKDAKTPNKDQNL